MHNIITSQSTTILQGNGIVYKLFGLPFLGAGLLMAGVVGREIVSALLAATYLSEPALIATHLLRIVFTLIFLGVGLLMCFGGIYARVDTERRAIYALSFYGFFGSWKRASFDDVVQVVLRARTTRPASAHVRRNDGVRRYYTYHITELELRDGRRMKLGSERDKAQVQARAERIAAQLGVGVIDIGLTR